MNKVDTKLTISMYSCFSCDFEQAFEIRILSNIYYGAFLDLFGPSTRQPFPQTFPLQMSDRVPNGTRMDQAKFVEGSL